MTQDSGHVYRQAAGRFASGVTVVTTQASEGAYGVTDSEAAHDEMRKHLDAVRGQLQIG